MNRSKEILLILAAIILGAAAQAQTSAQTDTQVNNQTSVQANKTGAQASSGGSVSSSASAQSGQTNSSIASGTAFNATLDKSIDAKRTKPGDPVTAHTTEANSDLPKGTKLIGHVTQASARANGDSASELGIQFDRAVLKNGKEVPLNTAIQAMAPARTADSFTNDDLDSISSGGINAGGAGMLGGRGVTGGLNSAGSVTSVAHTSGGVVGPLTHPAAVGGVVREPLNATAGPVTHVAGASQRAVGGLNTAGQLTSNSRGVFTMNDLSLNSAAGNATQGSVISSAGKNVRLDSGTRLLLVNQATASSAPSH